MSLFKQMSNVKAVQPTQNNAHQDKHLGSLNNIPMMTPKGDLNTFVNPCCKEHKLNNVHRMLNIANVHFSVVRVTKATSRAQLQSQVYSVTLRLLLTVRQEGTRPHWQEELLER